MRKSPLFRLIALLVGAFALAFTAAPLVASPQTPAPQKPMPGGRGAPAPPQKGDGFILGEVVDAATGRPLADAVVTLSLRGARGQTPPNMAEMLAGTGGNPMAAEMAANMMNMSGVAAGQVRVITGSDGKFVFRDLPKGAVGVQASLTAYVPGSAGQSRPNGPSRAIELDDAERLTDVTIRLWKYGVITGTLLDDSGEPAVGVMVTASRRSWAAGRSQFSGATFAKTDDRGQYRVSGLVPGDYSVSIPQMVMTMPVAFANTMMDTLSSMMPGFAQLAEMAGPQASMSAQGGMRVGDFVVTSSTGVAPPPPVYGRMFGYQPLFYPSATTAASATVISVGSGEERTGVNLQLKLVETARVSGIVSTATGPVGANVQVRLVPVGEQVSSMFGSDAANTMTLKDGSFTMLGVPPGQYTLEVVREPRPEMPAGMPVNPFADMMMPGGPAGGPTLSASVPLTIAGGDLTGLAVALREGLHVGGRLVFEGGDPNPPGAVANVMAVNLTPVDGGRQTVFSSGRQGTPDAEGLFKTQGHPPGRYLLQAGGRAGGWTMKSAISGGRDVTVDPLELKDADITDVVITMSKDRPPELGGTVRGTGKTSAPLLATVLIFPEDHEAWVRDGMSARRMRNVQASKTGAYTLAPAPTGNVLVVAIEDAEVGDVQNPAFFAALSRVATRVTILPGDKKTLDLTVVKVAR